MTKIQKVEIKQVYVPKIRLWEVQTPTLDLIYKPVVDIPACVDAHRNNLTGLINEDELGTYQACGTFDMPSFEPLELTLQTFNTPHQQNNRSNNKNHHHSNRQRFQKRKKKKNL